MYEMPFKTIEAGSKNSNIQYIKEDDIRLTEEKKEIDESKEIIENKIEKRKVSDCNAKNKSCKNRQKNKKAKTK